MFVEDFNYKPMEFFEIEDGEHRVKLLKAGLTEIKNKRVVELHYKVEGSNGVEYIERIFEGNYFDVFMSRVLDCFGIPAGDWAFGGWVGKIGRAKFTHKEEKWTDSQGNEKTTNKCVIASYIKNENCPAPIMPTAPKQAESVSSPIPTFTAINEAEEMGF